MIIKYLGVPVWQDAEAGGGTIEPEAAAPPPAAEAPAAPETPEPSGQYADGAEPGVLGSGNDDERKVVVQAEWPDDWRAKMAGENEKAAKILERYGDPAKVAEALLAAQQKISSGEYKKAVTEDSTEEEKAAARAEAGVPEEWSGYDIPEDLETIAFEQGTEDPMLQSFLERMHKAGASKDMVAEALRSVDALTREQQQQQIEQDKSYRVENEDRLRAQWGDEFRPRVSLYDRVLKDADGPIPRPVAEAIMTARDASGNRLVNNAQFAEFLVDLGVSHYGDGALISGEQARAQTSRLEEIRQVMKTDMNRYWSDPKMQEDYRQLLERESSRR